MKLQRTSPLSIAACAVIGIGVGLLVQVWRSTAGSGTFVPPLSLALTMVVMAGVLLGLGIALRRAITRASGKPVNPFHAVRLLAGAKAGQFSGALLGGFGGGLALQVLTRSVIPAADLWLPMLLVLIAGVALVVCGVITELLCRVPPTEGDDADAETDPKGTDPAAGTA